MDDVKLEPVSIKNLVTALCKAQQEIKNIREKETNKKEGWKYISYDQIIESVESALANNGVAAILLPKSELMKNDMITYKTRDGGEGKYHWVIIKAYWLICHQSGECMETISYGNALAYGGDKGFNIAQTYAKKNLFRNLLNIPVGEDDPDTGTPELEQGSYDKKIRSLMLDRDYLSQLEDSMQYVETKDHLSTFERNHIGNLNLLKDRMPELYAKYEATKAKVNAAGGMDKINQLKARM